MLVPHSPQPPSGHLKGAELEVEGAVSSFLPLGNPSPFAVPTSVCAKSQPSPFYPEQRLSQEGEGWSSQLLPAAKTSKQNLTLEWGAENTENQTQSNQTA